VPRKVYVNTAASKEEKDVFKKKIAHILVDKQEQQKQKQHHETEFILVSLYESFFFYDSLIRRVWIEENNRPIVKVTGSHKRSCIFGGAISMEDKQQQLFRQYDIFNGYTFL
jgi:hypothetical protein